MPTRLARRLSVLLTIVAAAHVALTPTEAQAATYTITTLLEDTADNGNCTLREALLAASTDSTNDLCVGDAGPDTIVLDVVGTYALQNGNLASAARQITVRGNPANPQSAYVVDLGNVQRFLQVLGGSALTLENLTLANGLDAASGGAVLAEDSDLTLRKVTFADNRANEGGAVAFRTPASAHQLEIFETTFSANTASGPQTFGGGLFVDLQNGGVARVVASRFLNNRLESVSGNFSRAGGGLFLQAFADATLELRHLEFAGNVIDAPGNARAAGLHVYTSNSTSGSFELADATFENNSFANLSNTNGAVGLNLDLDSPTATVRRLRIVANLGDPGRDQAAIQARAAAQAVVSDLVVGNGVGSGLFLSTGSSSTTLRAGNLTVAGHPDSGLGLARNAGVLRVENSIFFGNAASSGSNVNIFNGAPDVSAENLIGVDPQFVNAAGGDFRLGSISVAAEAGNQVFLSVGPFDAAHAARIVGPQLDLGALERGALFSDDFERNELHAWSSSVP